MVPLLKHLQYLPVAQVRAGRSGGARWVGVLGRQAAGRYAMHATLAACTITPAAHRCLLVRLSCPPLQECGRALFDLDANNMRVGSTGFCALCVLGVGWVTWSSTYHRRSRLRRLPGMCRWCDIVPLPRACSSGVSPPVLACVHDRRSGISTALGTGAAAWARQVQPHGTSGLRLLNHRVPRRTRSPASLHTGLLPAQLRAGRPGQSGRGGGADGWGAGGSADGPASANGVPMFALQALLHPPMRAPTAEVRAAVWGSPCPNRSLPCCNRSGMSRPSWPRWAAVCWRCTRTCASSGSASSRKRSARNASGRSSSSRGWVRGSAGRVAHHRR